MLRDQGEINDRLQKYFKKEFCIWGFNVDVVDYEDEDEIFVIINIGGESEVELTFDFLKDISNLIECKEIDIKYENYEGGCPTCNFGAKQDITLICW